MRMCRELKEAFVEEETLIGVIQHPDRTFQGTFADGNMKESTH